MDPITIWLLCLATAWFIRRGVEDAWAAAQGRESPRLARRRTQHELAQRHRADTGAPTIGQAVTGRIAQRIAEPREPGAFRRYLGELWEDSWVDAADAHRARRARKQRRAEAGPDAGEVMVDLHECDGGCEPPRWIPGDLDVCSECVEARYEWSDDDPAWADAAPDPDPDDDIVDAEIVEPDPQPVRMDKTNPTDQHDPEPTPAPATERKDTPVMTEPTTINGDTVSPLENLGYVDRCRAFNADIRDRLDTIANNLAGAGAGEGFVQIIHDAREAAQRYDDGLAEAQRVYAHHAHLQAEMAQDSDLANTLEGTYLGRATA